MNDIFESFLYSPVSITQREQETIDNVVLGCQFPWYYISQQTLNKDLKFLPKEIKPYMSYINSPFCSHTLLARTEVENVDHLSRKSNDFSYYYEFFMEIFHRFTVQHSIKYKKIFRANLNLNWYNGDGHTEPHLDHSWPHKNFIMYLNDCEQGQTILWPNDFSASYMIPCKKNTAVTFDSVWHGHRFPKILEKRVVFVVTYI